MSDRDESRAARCAVERIGAADRLRIAVLADFDSVHARSWLAWPIARGHEVHAVSYYPPRAPVAGATMHALRRRRSVGGTSGVATASRLPPAAAGVWRLAHGARYRVAGLRRVLRSIAPDVFHAHFVVEHGFYGALAGVRPLVVTAWGSDVLVAPRRDPVTRAIARWTLRRADLLTSNNAYMAEQMAALGARRDRIELVTLGADRSFLEAAARSVNIRPADASRVSVVVSTRAHEPLYNIDEIIDAFAWMRAAGVRARLVVAHGGALTAALRARAQRVPGIEFAGVLDRARFLDALADAEVFVSVPSSDGTSVAVLQAMAAGCFPVVADLPTQREWIEDGVNGFRVPLHRPGALADGIARALADAGLRRAAAARNRAIVEARGLNETQMLRMEALYRRLVDLRPPAR